jgi:hypothetical protein
MQAVTWAASYPRICITISNYTYEVYKRLVPYALTLKKWLTVAYMVSHIHVSDTFNNHPRHSELPFITIKCHQKSDRIDFS